MVADELAQQIIGSHRGALRRRLIRRSSVAIVHPLPQRDRAVGIIARPEPDWPVQAIVSLKDEGPFAVAPFNFVSEYVEHHSAQSGINALVAPRSVSEVVAIAKGNATERIRHREHITANVVGRARP